ncbi:MAG TPA: hypothetical protein VF747_06675 [Blastocatellia bacterium]|jgi:hypothetical protein
MSDTSTTSAADAAQETAGREPNSRKVKLRRITHKVPKLDENKQPVLDDKQEPVMVDEPVVMLTQASVPRPDKPYEHIELDPNQNEFEFSVDDAAYLLREHPSALGTVPDAPTKLKRNAKE